MKTAVKSLESEKTANLVPVLWCVLGLLLPRATLYGQLSPFGIGLAAAPGVGRWPVTAALVLGYLFARPVASPLRYVAAVVLVMGARWILAAVPSLERLRWVPAVVSFVCSLVTGLVIYGQGGLDAYRTLLIIAESLVAAVAALAFAAVEQSSTATKQAALLFITAATAMAATTLTVGGFAPGRAAAILPVLAAAYTGRESGGCVVGCVLGGGLALADPADMPMAVALALGGLAAGALAPYGRAVQAAVLFVAGGVLALAGEGDTMLWYLYELLAAGVVFLLLPDRFIAAMGGAFFHGREQAAAAGVRQHTALLMDSAVAALGDVETTLRQVSERLDKGHAFAADRVWAECKQTVCQGCPLLALCDGPKQGELFLSLEAAAADLRQQALPLRLTGYAADHCRRPERLAPALTAAYAAYTAGESARRRLTQLRQGVQGQLGATASLLAGMATDVQAPLPIDTTLSDRVTTLCRDYGMAVTRVVCSRDDRAGLTVDALLDGPPPAKGQWTEKLQRVCGQAFAAPTLCRWDGTTRLTLTPPSRYRVETAVSRRLCDGERLCGDATELFQAGGYTVAILSDGMGSGGRAAVDGAMAAGLTARLWQAGLCPEGILRTVNAALQVKSGDETLATLDVAVIDRHTGRLDSYKAGAATSLLRAGGRVSRLERPSLPLGILPGVGFEHSHDRLTAGDVLLLCSDGAYPEGVAAVEVMLRDAPADQPLQALTDSIADAARAATGRLGYPQDDITVVALRVE